MSVESSVIGSNGFRIATLRSKRRKGSGPFFEAESLETMT